MTKKCTISNLSSLGEVFVSSSHLICVSMERFDGLFGPELANVNAFVRGAGGEALVCLPINIQSRSRMEGKLLLVVARLRVPNDCRAINT